MGIELELNTNSRKVNAELDSVARSLDKISDASVKASDIKIKTNAPTVNRDLETINNSINAIKKSTDGAVSGFKNMAVGLAVMAASALSIGKVVSMSDELSAMRTRLQLITESAGEFGEALQSVKNIALSTRQSLISVSDLYQKMAMSTKAFGISQKQVALATQTVSKAIAMSGGNASSAAAAVMQLGQALASGNFQGDELRSIKEQAPLLANVIAKNLGVTIGELSKMGAEGRLNTIAVFDAILRGSDEVNENFKKVNLTFGQSLQNLGTSFRVLFDGIMNSKGSAIGAGSKSIMNYINDLALSIAYVGDNIDLILLEINSKLVSVANDLVRTFTFTFDKIKEAGHSALSGFGNFKLNIKTTDVSSIFPGLDKTIGIVKGFAKTVEGWFFWIYDRVIGHSWIPDLVDGVYNWMAKLTGKPVEYVRKFASLVQDLFMSLVKKSPFGALVTSIQQVTSKFDKMNKAKEIAFETSTSFDQSAAFLVPTENAAKKSAKEITTVFSNSFKSAIDSLMLAAAAIFSKGLPRIIAGVGAAFLGLKALLESTTFGAEANKPAVQDETRKMWNDPVTGTSHMAKILEFLRGKMAPFLNKMTDVFNSIIKSINGSAIVHTLKQMMGIQDKVKYNFERGGRTYSSDVNAHVGLGPKRNSSNRFIGHDFINALPDKAQIPTIAAVTGLIAAGIIGATSSGTVRTTLISLLTTGMGIAVAQTVDDKVISKFTDGVVGVFRKGVNIIVDGLFGSGLFGEKGFGGTLALIWKLSLLFKAGREATLSAMGRGVTAPTRLALTGIDAGYAKMNDNTVNKLTAQITKMPLDMRASVTAANAGVQSSLRSLVMARKADGSMVGLAAANQMMAGNQNVIPRSQMTLSIKDAAKNMQLAQAGVLKAQSKLVELPSRLAELEARRTAATGIRDGIRENLAEQRTNVIASTTRTGAAVGGIFGSMAGFKIGEQITEGMSNSPEWLKISVQLASAFAGQALLAGAGGAIARAFIMGVMGIGSLLLNPFVLGAALIGGAIFAAFKIWENWDIVGPALEDFMKRLPQILVDGAEQIRIAILKAMGNWNPEKEKASALNKATGKAVTEAKNNVDAAMASGDTEAIIKAVNDLKRADAAQLEAARAGSKVGLPIIADKFERPTGMYPEYENVSDADRRENLAALGTIKTAWANLIESIKTSPQALKHAGESILTIITGSRDAHGSEMPARQQYAAPLGNDTVTAIGDRIGAQMTRAADIMVAGKTELNFARMVEAIKSNEGSNADSVSPKGARGQLQIMEGTFNDYKKTGEVFTSEADRMAVSLRYLREQFDKTGGDVKLTAARYFGGPGAVDMETRTIKNPNATDNISTMQQYTDRAVAAFNKAKGDAGQAIIDKYEKGKTGASGMIDKAGDVVSQLGDAIAQAVSDRSFAPLSELFSKLMQKLGLSSDEKPVEAAAPPPPPPPDYKNLVSGSLNGVGDRVGVLGKINKALVELGEAEISPDLFNAFKPDELTKLVEFLDSMTEFSKEADAFTKANSYFMAEKNKGLVKSWTEQKNALIKQVQESNKELEGGRPHRASSLAVENGDNLLKNFKAETAYGLSAVLRGNASFKDVGKALVDNIQISIIESVSKGFLNSFTDSIGLDKIFKDFFTGLFDNSETLAQKAADKILNRAGESVSTGGIDTPGKGLLDGPSKNYMPGVPTESVAETVATSTASQTATLTSTLSGIWSSNASLLEKCFSSLYSIITSGLTGLIQMLTTGTAVGGGGGSLFGTIVLGIAGLFTGGSSTYPDTGVGSGFNSANWGVTKAAEGGLLSGPGTGTSDSIPLWGSNGEFMVNAKSTKENLGLLTAINEGKVKIPRFATGGLIGAGVTSSASGISLPKNSNSSIFNINITGDVSRQTRSEIQRMMPQIASGVNTHNYEKGKR